MLNSLFIIASFVLTTALIPLIIYLCKQKGWYDPVSNRKMHTGKVPRLGNLAIVPVFLASWLFYTGFNGGKEELIALLPVAGAGFFIFVTGLLDDFIEMPATIKFLFQCAGCVVPPLTGLVWEFLGMLPLGGFAGPLTFLWLLGLVNAYNLIDGLDGLCGGLSLITLAALSIVFFISGGDGWLPLVLCGGLLGFLIYNKPKAKIFLGDGGSQFLGFMIAIFPLTAEESIGCNAFPIAIMLTSIPTLDTVAAIWRRTREKISFLMPDKQHLHHKLLALGYSNWGILVFLYTIQAGLGAGAVLFIYKLNDYLGLILTIAFFGANIIFFSIIHYTYRAVKSYYPPPPPQHY
jgi:UDP-GlcNAc:undecaprenyl-phosphate GlcNAc-1-phosphate transferase